MSEQVDLAVLRRVASVSAQINDGRRLHDTLQAVAGGVVDALGFGAAAVNYVLANGDLQVMAVAGPPEACDALAGQIVEKAVMDDLLARSDPWGPLRFVPHEGSATASRSPGYRTWWCPKAPMPGTPKTPCWRSCGQRRNHGRRALGRPAPRPAPSRADAA